MNALQKYLSDNITQSEEVPDSAFPKRTIRVNPRDWDNPRISNVGGEHRGTSLPPRLSSLFRGVNTSPSAPSRGMVPEPPRPPGIKILGRPSNPGFFYRLSIIFADVLLVVFILLFFVALMYGLIQELG